MNNKKILNASEMGKRGGDARAKKLSSDELSEIGKMGAKARWKKKKKKRPLKNA